MCVFVCVWGEWNMMTRASMWLWSPRGKISPLVGPSVTYCLIQNVLSFFQVCWGHAGLAAPSHRLRERASWSSAQTSHSARYNVSYMLIHSVQFSIISGSCNAVNYKRCDYTSSFLPSFFFFFYISLIRNVCFVATFNLVYFTSEPGLVNKCHTDSQVACLLGRVWVTSCSMRLEMLATARECEQI